MIHPALRQDGDALRLAVRVTARAGRDAIAGLGEGADGRAELAVRLAAPPVEGAANAALLKLLAKQLSVPKSALEIVSGAQARHKIVRITGLSAEAATLRLESGAS